ncbi:MAG TPA: ferritin-like domain-containing protein, partial [Bauldia sp.]|nr:ferritin-like domain-containing protein [Bauldia sp.]
MPKPSPTEAHITHDPAYETVAADDFAAMVEVGRYGRRSDAFDGIIGATHDHFWDPYNPAYLDFTQGWNLDSEPLLPLERFPELNCAET